MSAEKNRKTKRKRHAMLIVTLATIALITLPMLALAHPIETNQTIDAPWSMWHHDPAHTGVADGSGPKNLAVKWAFNASAPLDSSPTVVDNRIYIGSRDHNLY